MKSQDLEFFFLAILRILEKRLMVKFSKFCLHGDTDRCCYVEMS